LAAVKSKTLTLVLLAAVIEKLVGESVTKVTGSPVVRDLKPVEKLTIAVRGLGVPKVVGQEPAVMLFASICTDWYLRELPVTPQTVKEDAGWIDTPPLGNREFAGKLRLSVPLAQLRSTVPSTALIQTVSGRINGAGCSLLNMPFAAVVPEL
jgi:hypothetical protein